jgi:mycothiol synthase
MTTFTLRPGRLEDLEQAVPMFNLSSRMMLGADEFDVEEYRAHWTSPDFQPETDARIAITSDGKMVGVIEVWNNTPPFLQNWVWGRVHPEHEGEGIGTALLEWAECHARKKLSLAESGTRVTMRTGQFAVNTAAKSLFESVGYIGVRHFFDMERVMDTPPEAPMLPDGIVIRSMMIPNEYEAMHRLDVEAFRDHWGYIERPFEDTFAALMHEVQFSPKHDPALWSVAMEGERMAGMVMGRLEAGGDSDAGWIDSLAVRKAYRKKGIALALLVHTFGELYKRGQRKAQLAVDADNLSGALRLYQRAGMHVFRQFDLYEKELRGGRDLTVQG